MRAMKDSGVEWIGEIPEEWETCRTKYKYLIMGGNGFKEHLQGQDTGEFPFYKVSDINGMGVYAGEARNYVNHNVITSERYNVIPCNSILIGKIGEALKKNHRKISVTRCIVDNNMQALVPLAETTNMYQYYLLCCVDMIWFDNGGTIPSVNNQKLLNHRIPSIPLNEQSRIADYLDTKCAEIDALIAGKEKTNALLKEYRQSIIYEAVTKGLDPTVPMRDSGVGWIGEIPEGWEVTALKRLGKPITGSTPSKDNSDYWDGSIPWLSSKDIKSDYIFESGDSITQLAMDECGLTLLPEGTLVFCVRSGILRHTFPVAVTRVPTTINQDLRALTLGAVIHPEYLLYYLRGMNSIIVTLYQKVGATVESIEMEWLLYLPISLPAEDEQSRIADYLDDKCTEIDTLITANNTTIQKLKEYRQSLIYEAVTGKVEV